MVERWRQRRAGARRYQHNCAKDLRGVEREERLFTQGWKCSSAPGVHYRHRAIVAADSARRDATPVARGVRKRREPAPGRWPLELARLQLRERCEAI